MPLIGAGLALVVLSGLVFLGLVSRSGVTAAGVAALASLYFLNNTVALGVFAGVEQEMSRTVSQERAIGRPAIPAVHVVARQAVRWFLLSSAGVLALSPVLVHGPLGGRWSLLGELIVGLFAACCASVVRGALAGSKQFGFYSATLATEGLTRLILCTALWLLGTQSAWLFGLAFVLGQFFAALVGAALFWLAGDRDRSRFTSPGVAAPIAGAGRMRFGLATALALLVIANLTNQAVVNLPPVVITAKLATQPELAIAIGLAVTLSRLPMFAFVPLQTMLLPRLTENAALGDRLGVRRQTLRTIAVCVLLGVIGIVVLATIGPWLLSVYRGKPAGLSGATMAGIGIGTLFLMTANVTQPALLALGRPRTVLIAYLTGAVAMVIAFVLPIGPVPSAVVSASIGPIALAIVMAAALLQATRDAQPISVAAQPAAEPAMHDEDVPVPDRRD
jgi:O-antigen/teichoic acid export membrane protein